MFYCLFFVMLKLISGFRVSQSNPHIVIFPPLAFCLMFLAAIDDYNLNPLFHWQLQISDIFKDRHSFTSYLVILKYCLHGRQD